MLYEYISLFLGIIKIMIFKIIYFKRLKMDRIPKMNNNFKIAIKKNSSMLSTQSKTFIFCFLKDSSSGKSFIDSIESPLA